MCRCFNDCRNGFDPPASFGLIDFVLVAAVDSFRDAFVFICFFFFSFSCNKNCFFACCTNRLRSFCSATCSWTNHCPVLVSSDVLSSLNVLFNFICFFFNIFLRACSCTNLIACFAISCFVFLSVVVLLTLLNVKSVCCFCTGSFGCNGFTTSV